jgi:hypothetical protein
MLTPILGKMPKTCQFSGWDLAANLSLAAYLPALSILAEQYAGGATSTEVAERARNREFGITASGVRIGAVEYLGSNVPLLRASAGLVNTSVRTFFWPGNSL